MSLSQLDREFTPSQMSRDFLNSLFPVGTFDFDRPTRNSLLSDKVYRTKEGLEYHVATPGVEKEDLDLKVEKDTLKITAKRRFDGTVVNVYTMELKLTEHADPVKITSKYNNGLLRISVPFKTKNDTSMKIVVE